jgi:hypothetical protein
MRAVLCTKLGDLQLEYASGNSPQIEAVDWGEGPGTVATGTTPPSTNTVQVRLTPLPHLDSCGAVVANGEKTGLVRCFRLGVVAATGYTEAEFLTALPLNVQLDHSPTPRVPRLRSCSTSSTR